MPASHQPTPSSSALTSVSLYYLYVGSEWSGPFQAEQVRFFRTHGQVESDTYAYDPDQQRHYTVGELLASLDAAPTVDGEAHPLVPRDLDESSTPSTTRIFLSHEIEPEATATLGTSLDALPEPLRSFWRVYIGLTEGHPIDREQELAHVRELASAIDIQCAAAQSDPEILGLITGDLLRLADYLANRHQDAALWEAIEVLRQHHPESDGEEVVKSSRLVIDCIVERAKQGRVAQASSGLVPSLRDAGRDVAPAMYDSQELRIPTDTWDQPHARTARLILRDARKELKSTEADLDAIQKAYATLQEAHTRDLDEAREMLAGLESARADEQSNAAQALAEVRSLAAEIHRLAEENLAGETDLKQEITHLAEELRGSDATAMAPLAEALLIRLVTRLRNLAAEGLGEALPADVLALREELARVRSEHVQARAQVMLLTDERDRLKRQLDEQRAAADRAIANSKEREQRLRSTVTALEVTKHLHQDVMRELDVQLQSAQRRVTDMETELSTVRVELKSTRITLADRTKELQDEMRRAVELRAMLEARREELSVNLKTAEAELTQAQVDQSSSGSSTDPQMMEALAAKVTHVRTMFEATKRRLDEQQVATAKLEDELALSRREASELRGRGDSLTSELDEARTGLSSAKKRFEELNRAHARLESERESLQAELTNRKGTDSLRRSTEKTEKGTDRTEAISGTAKLSRVMEQLEKGLHDTTGRLQHANDQLESERRRVSEIGENHQQLQLRVEDLTADRDHLRAELDKLHIEYFSEHSRNSASIAVSTQATIEAERRLKEATARVVELEDQVACFKDQQAAPGAALSQPSFEGDDHATGQVAELRARLANAQAEVEHLQAIAAGSASGQRHALVVRVAQVEADLATTVAARDESVIQLRSVIAERDRLSRDFARLKNEQESAAVEHRVALKSARDKYTESQARVQVLEHELDRARAADGTQASAHEHLTIERDHLKTERERLSDEVRELKLRIDKAALTEELPKVRVQLDQELDRIRALTRSLSDAQTQADAARVRVHELEAQAAGAQRERDTLQLDIERVRGELLMAQASVGVARDTDHERRNRVEARMHEVLNDREQLLGELSRVNAELMQVRGRLVRIESEAFVADRLPLEQARLRDLEAQVAQQRAEQAATNASLSEVRSQLAAVTAERDRLRDEVERLRAQLAAAPTAGLAIPELMALRDKLMRAKARIRALRKERDELLAKAGMPLPMHDVSGSRTGLTVAAGEFLPATSAFGRSLSSVTQSALAPLGSSGARPALTVPMIPTAAIRRAALSDRNVVEKDSQPTVSTAGHTRSVSVPVSRKLLRNVAWAGGAVLVLGATGLFLSPLPHVRGHIAAPLINIPAPVGGAWIGAAPQRGDHLESGVTIGWIENIAADERELEAAIQDQSALGAIRDALTPELVNGDTVDALASLRSALADQLLTATARVSEERASLAERRRVAISAPQSGVVWQATPGALIPGQTALVVVPTTTRMAITEQPLPADQFVEMRLADGRRLNGRTALVPQGAHTAEGQIMIEFGAEIQWTSIGDPVDVVVVGDGILAGVRSKITWLRVP